MFTQGENIFTKALQYQFTSIQFTKCQIRVREGQFNDQFVKYTHQNLKVNFKCY